MHRRHRVSANEATVESVTGNPWFAIVMTSTVVVTAIQVVGRLLLKRTTAATVTDDWQTLTTTLMTQVERLAGRVKELETRNAAMVAEAEEREARVVVKLKAVKDAAELKLETLYSQLEEARIRITALEHENKRLRSGMDVAV